VNGREEGKATIIHILPASFIVNKIGTMVKENPGLLQIRKGLTAFGSLIQEPTASVGGNEAKRRSNNLG